MHDRWSRYHMSREMLQVCEKGVLCRLPGLGIGDRGQDMGLARIERPRRVCCPRRRASHSGETGSISLSAGCAHRTVRLGGCWRTAIVRANMREIAISMLET